MRFLYTLVALLLFTSLPSLACDVNPGIINFIGESQLAVVVCAEGSAFYPNGKYAGRKGDSWFYPDGTYAGKKDGTWFYPNGKYAGTEEGSWFHSNGAYAGRKGDSWFYANQKYAGKLF